jgi:hypothetical protein
LGQASIDLPDPTEMPPPMASADDLLSQLAGDEIDRLLAEAEVDKGPLAAAPEVEETPAPAQTPVQEQAPTAADIDDLLNKATAPASGAGPNAAAVQAAMLGEPAPIKPRVGSTMPGAVLVPDPSPEPELAPIDLKAEARELDEALAKGSTDALPEVKAIEAETSSAEKNALTDAINSIDVVAQASAPASLAAPVPFYLKPLVWLNFPMELLPPAAREAIGKVALLTLVNSVAILAYVLLFRKHH